MGKTGPLRDPGHDLIHCTTLNDDEIQMIVDSGGPGFPGFAGGDDDGTWDGAYPTLPGRGLRPSLSVDVETNVPNDMFTQMRSVYPAALLDLRREAAR